ncbi:MAG: hypothetical protein M1840_000025 [Geoglossum simile]|nr:MAG: hypothetical protein M1840_000025 [Geoglossum simile]
MPTDAAHAKFLYTILKQLDLKSVHFPRLSFSSSLHVLTTLLPIQIDWNLVASQLEITNGHAARMRFSRFKQHMEGVTPGSRRRASSMAGGEGRVGKRYKSERGGKNKRDKEAVQDEGGDDDENGGPSSAATTIEQKVEEITTIKPELLSLYSTPPPPPTFQPPLHETDTEMGDYQTIAPFANMVEVKEEAPQEKREIAVKVEPWEEED